ncbi:MAG: 2-oxo acid dehydrogenase subunit E2 [Alistipes sp.]|nr:2-oxo acid dehydrogenase subunit E2 [Candidatus Minthomonas equi]
MPETKPKRDRRDRYDRIYLKDLDAMHHILPMFIPKRCDNEVVASEIIDIEAITKYIEEKNSHNPVFKYTWFHVISAAIAKVLVLRPKMNWFISGPRMYANRDVKLSFIVKRTFEDSSEEAVAKVKIEPQAGSPVEQIHDYVEKFVTKVRKEKEREKTTDTMYFLKKVPLFLLRLFFWSIRKLEMWGRYPKSLAEQDPCYSSVFITNLGSIHLNADYHHLYEGGTMSMFVVIGTRKMRPIFNPDGTYEMHDTIKLSLTIDERIADGYYFGNSLKLLRKLLQNPELLDSDVQTPVETD